jgi:hypothetical protein
MRNSPLVLSTYLNGCEYSCVAVQTRDNLLCTHKVTQRVDGADSIVIGVFRVTRYTPLHISDKHVTQMFLLRVHCCAPFSKHDVILSYMSSAVGRTSQNKPWSTESEPSYQHIKFPYPNREQVMFLKFTVPRPRSF